MSQVIRLSGPVDYGDRTVIPVIRETTMMSDHCGMVVRDPVCLLIMEDNQFWFVALNEGVTQSVIDELPGIQE